MRAGGVVAGKLKIVDFGDYVGAARAKTARASAPRPATTPTARRRPRASAAARSSSRTCTLVERMVQLTEVRARFEALQRGISMLMNDIDGRAITELGRR